jgi:mevalonate kinase
MLFGEYAVLEGHDAISCAFDARIAVSAVALDEPRIEIDSPRVLSEPASYPLEALGGPPPERLAFVWACLTRRAPLPWGGGVLLRIDADFPREWGFGSSSAVTVATLAALSALAYPDPTPANPIMLAAEATALIQKAQGGIGSGYDAASQAVGGLIRYRMPASPGELPEVERLPLPPAEGPSLFAAFTSRKVSTPFMVREVRKQYPKGHPVYAEIGDLASRAAIAARAGRWDELGRLMIKGQEKHEKLGTSPPDLSRALAEALGEKGVLGAKLTGAGGGDSALLLCEDERTAREACRRAGLTLLASRPDPEGLREEAEK